MLALENFQSQGSLSSPFPTDSPAGFGPAVAAKCQGSVLSTQNLQTFWGMKKCSSHNNKKTPKNYYILHKNARNSFFGFVYVTG